MFEKVSKHAVEKNSVFFLLLVALGLTAARTSFFLNGGKKFVSEALFRSRQ